MSKTQSQIEIRYRYFRVTYVGATDYKPSRIKIHDMRQDIKKFISYDYEFNNISDQAISYLGKLGINVEALAIANKDSDCLLLTKNFSTELK